MAYNGGVYAWNYYRPLIDQQRYAEIGDTLKSIIDILMDLEFGDLKKNLLFDLSLVHLKALEHTYLIDTIQKSSQSMETKSLFRTLPATKAYVGEPQVLQVVLWISLIFLDHMYEGFHTPMTGSAWVWWTSSG